MIEKHNAAVLAGDVDAVMVIRKEAQDLAVKLNGGELLGIDGGEGSPVDLLEKATDAPAGQIPLWGQRGSYVITVGEMPIRIEQDGIFGLGCGFSLWPGFSAHVVDERKPFLSETGYRSFLGVHAGLEKGTTPDRFAAEACRAYIGRECKGSLEPKYAERLRADPTSASSRVR